MSQFEAFTQKGGRYVTQKTMSLSMNQYGHLNVPASVSKSVFEGSDYVVLHYDIDSQFLAIEPCNGDPPAYAYKLSGDSSKSVNITKVLEMLDKQPPEKHTMFELQHDDDSGLPYIDVSGLPEWEYQGS